MKIHLENVEELKNYMYLPEDITKYITRLIKIEIKLQTYEEKLRVKRRRRFENKKKVLISQPTVEQPVWLTTLFL
ncbi:MAG: hypothetical protein B6U88_03440 [Candidatus Aenigmarchaeota archaeon ex4484_56]|nr:MAG: hypothetical protein B6U88_03440 [Candidatus Aenigmarchaeota archaeon ex4484_56]